MGEHEVWKYMIIKNFKMKKCQMGWYLSILSISVLFIDLLQIIIISFTFIIIIIGLSLLLEAWWKSIANRHNDGGKMKLKCSLFQKYFKVFSIVVVVVAMNKVIIEKW